jgi:hypothetical protein
MNVACIVDIDVITLHDRYQGLCLGLHELPYGETVGLLQSVLQNVTHSTPCNCTVSRTFQVVNLAEDFTDSHLQDNP